jgi:hypothetical protein
VQNVVPEGASWDGKTDLPVDEETFRSMLSDRDPQASPNAGGSGPAKSPAHTETESSGTVPHSGGTPPANTAPAGGSSAPGAAPSKTGS